LQVNKAITENVGLVLLPALIEDIKFSIKNIIEKERVSILYDFEEGGELYSLKSFMHSIFYNLIQNSIKYRRLDIDPVINIKTQMSNGKMTVIYTDNGRGIDTSKYANEIFGLYKRFDTSVEGKGMGLFMVKMQVESLDGNISIKSELNKGTEFLLEFPLPAPEEINV
jgi:signal transduction histidine kinase